MKGINNLLSRFRKAFLPRQGKKGASLALVMMIGAVLVIWVMGIMPLMSATGTVAYKTEGNLINYLGNRSAIEFCKSELKKIVETESPYTFCVTQDDQGNYTAHRKYNESYDPREPEIYVHNPEYTGLITDFRFLTPTQGNDDRDDQPKDNSVVAICAITPNEENASLFDITIITYNDGKPGMRYSLTFTPAGSLAIQPESYNRSQALPLSDFVVVDGKLGSNKIWNSTINLGNASTLGFTEYLLPLVTPGHSLYREDMANSGKYPAVFKTTANAATDDNTITIIDELTMDPLSTNEIWYMAKSGNSSYGHIWYVVDKSSRDIKIYMKSKDENGQDIDEDITDDCNIFLNGDRTYDNKIPDGPFAYTLSVDYKGTDYSTEDHLEQHDPNRINVLPRKGLVLGDTDDIYNIINHELHDEEVGFIETIEFVKVDEKSDNYTVTVTLNITENEEDTPLIYGYCAADAQAEDNGKIRLSWSDSPVITGLNKDQSYYFYICRPATFFGGVFMGDSPVRHVATMFKPTTVSNPEAGKSYAIVNQENLALSGSLSLEQIPMMNGYILSGTPSLTWTVEQNGDGVSFKNGSNYLNISGTIGDYSTNYVETRHSTGWYSSHNCYEIVGTAKDEGVTGSVSLGNASRLHISDDGGIYTVATKTVEVSSKYWSKNRWGNYSECNRSENNPKPYSFTVTSDPIYLNLDGNVGAEVNAPYAIKYMNLPGTAPTNVTSPSPVYATLSGQNAVTYGTDITAYVRSKTNSGATVYANGKNNPGVLNAGVYHIIVKVNNRFANLGQLTVEKGALNTTAMKIVSVSQNSADEVQIDVLSDGWADNGGIRYVGFKARTKKGSWGQSDQFESEYHWFATDKSVISFRLPYKNAYDDNVYQFFIMDSGTNNFSEVTKTYESNFTVSKKNVDLQSGDGEKFLYSIDLSNGKITWYDTPHNLYPERIHFVYGYTCTCCKYPREITRTESDEWKGASFRDKYLWDDHDYLLNKYSVYVDVSNHDSSWDTFTIRPPLETNQMNGHIASMMKGSSLYFMGDGYSIDTYGTDVYLNTDLLVLKNDIKAGVGSDGKPCGRVLVKPYNKSQTLLYAVQDIKNPDGQVIFNAKTFYWIEPEADILAFNPLSDNGVKQKYILCSDTEAKDAFNIHKYPKINMDIAFANRSQLANIINSETLGWTVNGVLSGSSNSTNRLYAVPTYVESIEGAPSYKANRILLAAHNGQLTLPDNLIFTSRYFSLDAEKVTKTGGNGFFLKNMSKDSGFISEVLDILGVTSYTSKSFQLDFERTVEIGDVEQSKRICRPLENAAVNGSTNEKDFDAVNLFVAHKDEPLMAPYTAEEIEAMFPKPSWIFDLGGYALSGRTVDRYIKISDTDGDNKITISSVVYANYSIFSNYIHFDSSIKEINFESYRSSMSINSQERGYKDEYLGLFTNYSTESYGGTLLYFGNNVVVTVGGETFTVESGFYYIYATADGTPISSLKEENRFDMSTLQPGQNINDENTSRKPYKIINPQVNLKNYSVYIDPTTGMVTEDAYVETDLFGNYTDDLTGSFNGGSVG